MSLKEFVDSKLASVPPFYVVCGTLASVYALDFCLRAVEEGRVLKRINAAKWKAVRTVFAPIVRREIEKASTFTFPSIDGDPTFSRLPEKGFEHKEVVAIASDRHSRMDQNYSTGGLSGTVYHGGEEHTLLINKVMEIYQWTNPLHLDVFGAVRKMDAEVVSMCVALYNGASIDACGALTSGGTESIAMAVKTYRDWGREVKGLTHTSIVMPVTGHPAFDKACAYYGLDLIKVPVNEMGIVDIEEFKMHIKYNTVAIVGSAPCFPFGIVDPIPQLAELARERKIGMHVDACLGGFIVPFMTEAGFPGMPIVDFRNEGVTTISCDSHKYGFAPKGTSVVMYRSKSLRAYQYFAIAEWPGGIYCSPGASGSKAGNVIAGTWAAMLSMGKDGYVTCCREIVSAAQGMVKGINTIPYLHVIGDPRGSVFAFTSTTIDIFMLMDKLKKRGWALNPLQFPSALQFSVTLLQAQSGVVTRFLHDLRECGDELMLDVHRLQAEGKKVPSAIEGGTMYGSQQRVSDRTIIEHVMVNYLDGYYNLNL